MSPLKQDDETAKDTIKPDFLQEMGISPEEQADMETNAYSGAADDMAKKQGLSSDELASKEIDASDPESTDADKEEQEHQPENRGAWRTNISNTRANTKTLRNLGIAGGIAGLFIVALLALFSFLLPFKLTHIVESIEQRVGQVPEYAVEQRLEYYMNRYMMIRALEATGEFDFREGGDDRNRFTYLGDGFWRSMYTNWRGAKLEVKLLEKHNIKLMPTNNADFYRNNPRQLANHFELRDLGVGSDSSQRTRVLNRTEARQFIKTFARNETKSRQVLKRYTTRRILKNYYGVGNWKPFEKSRDNARNKYYEKKRAFQVRLINETVGRFSERYPKYLECMLGSSSSKECRDILKKADPNTTLPNGDDDGRKDSEELVESEPDNNDRDSRRGLARRIQNKIREFGLKKVIAAIAGPAALLTWVDTISHIQGSLDSGVLNQIVYDKNAQQYLAYTAPFLSAADQIRAGEDFDIEDARVAQEVFTHYTESPVYQIDSPRPNTVSAAGTIYRDCDGNDANGKETQLEPGETVCPEKRLVQDKTSFTETDGWKALDSTLDAYRGSPIKTVFDFFNDLVSGIVDVTGLDSVIQKLTEISGFDDILAAGFAALMNRIAAPVITGAEVDGDAYDSLYAGIAVKNSAVGGEVGVAKEDTIGGAYLSDLQTAAIQQSQLLEYERELQNKPFLARMFSPGIKESLTGRMALSAPSNIAEAGRLAASRISSFGYFFSSISSVFTPRVHAQNMAYSNPFHVLNMGFPVNHEIFTANNGEGMDFDEVSSKYSCDKPVDERPQNVGSDAFGQPDGITFQVPVKVDPCLLEVAVVDVSTRYFTGSFDEGISGQTTSNSSGGQATVGNTANVQCAPGTTDVGEADGYSAGQKYIIRLCEIPGFVSSSSEDVNGLVRVNSTASEKWLQLYRQSLGGGIVLKANSSFRTMAKQQNLYGCFKSGDCNNGNEAAKPGYSNHQIGFAIDIDIVAGKDPTLTACKANPDAYPVYKWLASNAPPLGIDAKVSSECWHWAVGGN